jgi:hypothetical protein
VVKGGDRTRHLNRDCAALKRHVEAEKYQHLHSLQTGKPGPAVFVQRHGETPQSEFFVHWPQNADATVGLRIMGIEITAPMAAARNKTPIAPRRSNSFRSAFVSTLRGACSFVTRDLFNDRAA